MDTPPVFCWFGLCFGDVVKGGVSKSVSDTLRYALSVSDTLSESSQVSVGYAELFSCVFEGNHNVMEKHHQ